MCFLDWFNAVEEILNEKCGTNTEALGVVGWKRYYELELSPEEAAVAGLETAIYGW